MSDNQSIFHEDWRDCLKAHYMYVVQHDDRVTEPSLHEILLRVGFSEDEIREMAIRAKMRDTDAAPDELPGL
ncbi:MAG: hypothetical protein Kow0077_00420 [Anaerolineae bacterium]